MEREEAGVSRRVLVALWMNGVFGQDVVEGIHDWMRDNAARWRIRFADSGNLAATSVQWMLGEHSLDGVISYYRTASMLSPLRDAGVPAVVLGEYRASDAADSDDGGRPQTPDSLLACVELDLPALARVLAEHVFARADFRSAAFVESHFDHGWSSHRGDALMAEFDRRGIAARRFLHWGKPSRVNYDNKPDFDGLAAFLRDIPKPAAVFCASDSTAADVIQICEAQGISVPRDLAVAGIDDNPVFCRHASPNITSAHLDGRRAGYLAAGALAAMMGGGPPPPPEALRYVGSVSRRASTAATPSIGDIVQRALDYIDLNACRGATLSDVVRHCCYSRTLVALRFRQMTGKSIVRAIRERRLDEARRYLRETSMTAEEIAPLCGYESASALHRAFTRDTGITMGAWRRGNAKTDFSAHAKKHEETP